DPDLALEVALALLHLFRLHREDVALDLVDLLLADVVDVIEVARLVRHHERLHAAQILHVLRAEAERLQRRNRRVDDALGALAVGTENDVLDELPLADRATLAIAV